MSAQETTAASTLTGTGIGRGVALGPVLRMPEPLPEPDSTPSTLGVDAEKERARASLAATAAVIRHRGERAGGSAKDVLEAQAFMAEDPTLADDVASRIDGGATAERAVFELDNLCMMIGLQRSLASLFAEQILECRLDYRRIKANPL